MFIKANKFRKNRLDPIIDIRDINDFLCEMAEKVFWTAWYVQLKIMLDFSVIWAVAEMKLTLSFVTVLLIASLNLSSGNKKDSLVAKQENSKIR